MRRHATSRNPFNPLPLDEQTELDALARALQLAEGFTLLFACCNQPDQSRRLAAELKTRLPQFTVQEIEFREPISHLMHELEQRIAEPPPNVVFVYGLYNSLPVAANAPFVLNLNAARNSFSKYISCPLVLWIPEYILTAISRGAPDFFSVRSGVYYFADILPEKTATDIFVPGSPISSQAQINDATQEKTTAEPLLSSSHVAMAGLSYPEKKERIDTLQRLLNDSEKLPSEQRDLSMEARLLDTLGKLYYILGCYAEAEPLLERALAIREKIGGPKHREVATSLNNIALLYYRTGRYAMAEQQFRRGLALREEGLGSESLDTAASLSDLARLYDAQGRYAEAEPLLQRALEIRKKAEGPEHFEMGYAYNNLGTLYTHQSDYARAEPLLQHALNLWESGLGSDHPDVATALNNLARLYQYQGRLAEAEPLYRRALTIQENMMGPEHPSVAVILENYVTLLDAMGRSDEALALSAHAKAIRNARESR